MNRLFENLSQSSLPRRIFLPLLKALAFDFSMKHPWVDGARVSLNSFKHKGYWFFGRGREEQSMRLFADLIKPGAHVIEVGGHIGFISAFFAKLAGKDGSVTVFEPGSNNLPYIRRNLAALSGRKVLAPLTLVEKAVGNFCGTVEFFEENLTGQNNSIASDFQGLRDNADIAFTKLETSTRTVPITTLDSELHDHDVNFVKIDVEGHEYGVLQGMTGILERCRPVLMVEVQDSEQEIFDLLKNAGYLIFDEGRIEIKNPADLKLNVFALNKINHGKILQDVFLVN